MDDFFKLECYIELIKELNDLKLFYSLSYGKQDVFGHIKYSFHQLNNIRIRKVFSELEKLEIATRENNHSSYLTLRDEVRHKLLSIIALIPNTEIANEVYLRNYKLYLEYCEARTDRPELLFDTTTDLETDETVWISKHDKFESWLAGKPIPYVLINEGLLDSVCKYFNCERRFINSNCTYQGYVDNKYIHNLDFNKLGDVLVNEKWINFDQCRAFKILFAGNIHYEPLQWNGGLSDLNKFIQAMYVLGIKESKLPNIEWTSFSSFILVNNDFPDPKNLKGAFSPKDKSIKAFTPFGSMIKDALI